MSESVQRDMRIRSEVGTARLVNGQHGNNERGRARNAMPTMTPGLPQRGEPLC